jgi:hypothetical protein
MPTAYFPNRPTTRLDFESWLATLLPRDRPIAEQLGPGRVDRPFRETLSAFGGTD